MKKYTKPELIDTNNSRIVTVLAAKAVGMLIGAYAAKKLLGDDDTKSIQALESVIAFA